MKTKFVRLLFAVCTAFIGSHAMAQAQENDGNKFLRSCSAGIRSADGGQLSDAELTDAWYCVAYISGFLDATVLTLKFAKGNSEICLPERGVGVDQAMRIFVKYLRDNPQILHESGRTSLYIALGKTFPCRTSRLQGNK